MTGLFYQELQSPCLKQPEPGNMGNMGPAQSYKSYYFLMEDFKIRQNFRENDDNVLAFASL